MAEEQITVAAYSGCRVEESPRELILHGNKVEVVEILNAWIEEGAESRSLKRFFEVKGDDGSIHKIHYDEDKKKWFCEVASQ